jgi:hypothetical protein
MPEPRYFSIPSAVVGGVVLRKSALNWRPWVRSVIQTPTAWMNSPAEMEAKVGFKGQLPEPRWVMMR